MTVTDQDPDTLCVNTIRGLCMDAIERADPFGSGKSRGRAQRADDAPGRPGRPPEYQPDGKPVRRPCAGWRWGYRGQAGSW